MTKLLLNYSFSYFQADPSKRTIVPVRKFQCERHIQYFLIYFEEDKSYEIVCSNSTLLPHDFNSDNASVKDTVPVKPDMIGKIIAKSRYENDKKLNEIEERQEDVLDTSSLSFLNKSIRPENHLDSCGDHAYLDDSDTENDVDNFAASSVQDNLNQSKVTASSCCHTCHTYAKKHTELLTSIVKLQKISLRELKKSIIRNLMPILKLLRMWKLLCITMSTSVSWDQRICLLQCLESELLGNFLVMRNLLKKCCSQSGILAENPLSPMRSKKFEKAVNARFSDEEALKVAVSAVKKLGIDLKRGRRKRRFDP